MTTTEAAEGVESTCSLCPGSGEDRTGPVGEVSAAWVAVCGYPVPAQPADGRFARWADLVEVAADLTAVTEPLLVPGRRGRADWSTLRAAEAVLHRPDPHYPAWRDALLDLVDAVRRHG